MAAIWGLWPHKQQSKVLKVVKARSQPKYQFFDQVAAFKGNSKRKLLSPFRDWSLITGRGGYKTGGGAREVLPYEKGGGGVAEKVLAMLKGGHNKFWGTVESRS